MTDYTSVHGNIQMSSLHPDGKVHWEEASPPDILTRQFRGSLKHCSYCGSIHPSVVASAIRSGATGTWANQKYGWPHKSYFDNVPNPHVGLQESTTACSHPPTQEQLDNGETWLPPEDGSRMWSQLSQARPTVYAKFYTVHLLDATPEDRETIEQHLGLKFDFTPAASGSYDVSWKPFNNV